MLPDHDTMVLNVLAFYADATSAERRAGRAWYPNARGVATALAREYLVSVETTAAVIAVLSPQMEWNANVRWARETVHAYYNAAPLPRRGLGNSLDRARRALDGDRSDVLREDGTLKVRNFYGSIIGERGAVCVDRHALRVVIGDHTVNPPALTDNRYRTAANAYRDTARELKVSVSSVQAITWLVAKRRREGK